MISDIEKKNFFVISVLKTSFNIRNEFQNLFKLKEAFFSEVFVVVFWLISMKTNSCKNVKIFFPQNFRRAFQWYENYIIMT